jgi:peptidoglycan/LPS O-acetylase OafA/YrhL
MEKRHFVFLDGLRGIAAFSVGVLHASIVFKTSYRPSHVYLAVDFFFCLSGFVIAYAYDDRLKFGMSFKNFCKHRLIRLYPMILAGVLIGFVAAVIWQSFQGTAQLYTDIMLLLFTISLIPISILFHHQAFPLDSPLWSIFFELVANIAYGTQQRNTRLSASVMFAAIIFSGMMLVGVTWYFKTVESIGFSNPETFVCGFVRVFYPFFAGVVIFRFALFDHWIRIPSLLIATILLAIMFLPVGTNITWLYDDGAVLFVTPTIITLGARATDVIDLSKFWKVLGKLSFPFYVVHFPILRIVYVICAGIGVEQSSPYLSSLFGLSAALMVAYALVQLYDEPVRRWLLKMDELAQLADTENDRLHSR